MTLQEFDRAIDAYRRQWKRCVSIRKLITLSGQGDDAVMKYALYDAAGVHRMTGVWTAAIANSRAEEFEWERLMPSRTLTR